MKFEHIPSCEGEPCACRETLLRLTDEWIARFEASLAQAREDVRVFKKLGREKPAQMAAIQVAAIESQLEDLREDRKELLST